MYQGGRYGQYQGRVRLIEGVARINGRVGSMVGGSVRLVVGCSV